MAFKNLRLAAIVGLAALTGGATLAIGQTSAEEAADAAAEIAAEAESAIRAIDPTTGGPSLVIDASLPQPYDIQSYAEEALPELPPATLSEPVFDEVTVGTPVAVQRRA